MDTLPQVPHPLPAPLAEMIAERFRILGDPTRIRLLDHLRDGPATAAEMQAATGGSQQNVSKHLGLLVGAGLVARTRDGNRWTYSIADEMVYALCEEVCGGLRRRFAEMNGLLDGRAA